MKKLCVVLCLLALVMLLPAAASLEYVNMENHGSAVTRIVIGWNGSSGTEVFRSDAGLDVLIKDYLASSATINFKSGALVSGIEQQNNTIRIKVKSSFRFEQLNLGNKLAVDIFTDNPDKAQRLIIADFYASTGKLNTADKVFNDLHIDYREDSEILYKWALLLNRRGSARATEKLAMIPVSSPYYAKGQQLMAIIHGDEEPLPPPPQTEEKAEIMPVPALTDTLAKDTLSTAPQAVAPVKQPARKSFAFPFVPFLIVLGAVLIVFVLFFSLLGKKKKPALNNYTPIMKESETALDSKTMCRMVSKLIADGWTRREIARELKISLKEVEQYLLLCHQGGHDEHEV